MRAEAPGAAAVSRKDCETRQAATGPWPRESPGAPERLARQRRERSPPRRFAPRVPFANGRVGFRHQLDPRLCDQFQPAPRMPEVLLLRDCFVLLGRADSQELQARLGHRRGKIAVRHEGHFGPSLLQARPNPIRG